MIVYLNGIDPVKGVPARHFIYCNPGNHLGTSTVPAAWTKKDAQGGIVGADQIVEFVNGKATVEDALGKYLIERDEAALAATLAALGSRIGGDFSSSATMMIRRCECGGDGMCTCTTAPLNPLGGPRMQASAKPTTVAVHPHLLQRLAKCGFTKCEDPENRLSPFQLATILEGESVADRIALKMLVQQAGIAPLVGG